MFCIRCGGGLAIKARFCPGCGMKIEATNLTEFKADQEVGFTASASSFAKVPEISNVGIKPLNGISGQELKQEIRSPSGWRLLKYYLLILIGGALCLTNPAEDEFKAFVVELVQSKFRAQNSLGKLLVKGVVYLLVSENYVRSDYLLFSVYRVDTSIFHLYDEGIPRGLKVLGIAGGFYSMPLSGAGDYPLRD